MNNTFVKEICQLISEELGYSFGDGTGNSNTTQLKIGELTRGANGVFAVTSGAAEPDRYTPIERRTIDFESINDSSEQGEFDLRRIYDLLHQNSHYNTVNYQVYYSHALGQIDDLDKDAQGRKIYRVTFEFITRDYSFGDTSINNKLTTNNHANLNNLAWSLAGHTIDQDIDFQNYGIDNLDHADFNTDTMSGFKVGRMRWNATDRCLEYDSYVNGSEVTNQIGQETWIRVRNNTGAIIENGKAVYVTGAVGNRPTIALARADSLATSLTYIGLTTEEIGINQDGFVTVRGSVRGVNTNDFTAGNILYLSETTAGELTETRPEAPNIVVGVGITTVKSGTGEIGVDSRIIPNLSRLSDVYVNAIANGDILVWNNSTGRFENTKKIGDGTNYSEFESDGTVKFNGDATVWKDINIGGTSLRQGASNQPSLVNLNSSNILLYEFSSSQNNELHGAFELQHDYKEGTDLVAHLHWYPTNTNTGNVKWDIEYYVNYGGSNILTGTLTVLSAGMGVAWEQMRVDIGTIVGTNLKIGSQIHFRLRRNGTDGTDTYNDGAAIATFGIHYEIDTIGSRQITTK